MIDNLPKPVSNIECYLSAIAQPKQSNGYLPIPVSRLDHYLKTIAVNGIGSGTGTGHDGKDGKEVELIADDTWIKWRYKGESLWKNLVAIAELKGSFDPNMVFADLQTTAKTVTAAINEVNSRKLSLSGGTMSGAIMQPLAPTITDHLTNKAYVDTKVASLIDGAPGGLDTLNKLAEALEADANMSTTLLNLIGNKLDLIEAVTTPQPGKVLRLDVNSDLPANITGNALTASRLKNKILVNGEQWDGSTDINISADVKISDWQAATYYKRDDIVIYNDRLYRAIQPHTSSMIFTDDMIVGIEKWKTIGNNGADNGSNNYTQITKIGIIATTATPKIIEILIGSTYTFNLPPVEILKFAPGLQNQVKSICAFDNADADDFMVGGESGELAKYVTFDGTMRLKTEYAIVMGDPVALGDGFMCESEEIDFADYKKVEAVK